MARTIHVRHYLRSNNVAVREVLRMGDSRLLQESEPVSEFDTPELHSLVRDLFDTMDHLNGAGLAAPQIGVMQRVVVFRVDANPRYPDVDSVPQTVLVNPQISITGDDTAGMWEGCLSVPGVSHSQYFTHCHVVAMPLSK